MADDVDLAQEINQLLQDDAMAVWRRKQAKGESRTHCEDCGEEISEKRRLAVRGCTRCVSCQEAFEIHMHWRAV